MHPQRQRNKTQYGYDIKATQSCFYFFLKASHSVSSVQVFVLAHFDTYFDNMTFHDSIGNFLLSCCLAVLDANVIELCVIKSED